MIRAIPIICSIRGLGFGARTRDYADLWITRMSAVPIIWTICKSAKSGCSEMRTNNRMNRQNRINRLTPLWHQSNRLLRLLLRHKAHNRFVLFILLILFLLSRFWPRARWFTGFSDWTDSFCVIPIIRSIRGLGCGARTTDYADLWITRMSAAPIIWIIWKSVK